VDVVLLRSLPDILGCGFHIAITIVGVAVANRRLAPPVIAAMIAFFVPFLVFRNLHLHHSY
jgi:hypothetical protein